VWVKKLEKLNLENQEKDDLVEQLDTQIKKVQICEYIYHHATMCA